MTQIWPGSVVRLATTFTVDEVPTDPDITSLTVTTPDGDDTPYAYDPGPIVRDGAGAFHLDYATVLPGLYRWRWLGTGAAAGPDEGSFYVEQSLATYPGFCTLEDVKLTRRISGETSDVLIMRLIAGASEAVRDHADGRKFRADEAASSRFFLLEPFRRSRDVLIDDLSGTPMEAEIVDDAGESVATLTVADDLVTLPRNRETDRPITAVRLRASAGWGHELRLKGVWGFPIVPLVVREATIEAVVEWHKSDQALTLESPEDLALDQPARRALPQASRDMLTRFRRVGAA